MTNSTSDYHFANEDSILAWRPRYERLGLRTIPLIGKRPFGLGSWMSDDVSARWQLAGEDFNGNIGILLGDGLVVVDADDEDTTASVASGFGSMRLSPPAVKTPHGMHFYLRVSDVPAGFNCSRLPA